MLKGVILHAANFAAPYGGNFIASLIALETRCEREGCSLVVAVPSKAADKAWCAQLVAQGHQVRFLPDDGSTLGYATRLAELVLATQADLLHTHFSSYDVAAWGARCLLLPRRRELAVVWHAHSDFPSSATAARRVKDVLKYRVMGNSVQMVAVSEHVRQRMIDCGFDASAVRTIPNGVDIARASSAARSKAQMHADLGIPPEAALLLLFGWEPWIKGVDVAMDAAHQLVQNGRCIRLAVVGTSALHDFVLRRSSGRVPPWLQILEPTENVADLYGAASVFVSASRNEGFPYSVCEAMASGLPVVLSDIPGVSWARRGSGAVFFPSGDGAALAGRIDEVLNWSAQERRHNAEVTQDFVRRELQIGVWADRIVELYREMLR